MTLIRNAVTNVANAVTSKSTNDDNDKVVAVAPEESTTVVGDEETGNAAVPNETEQPNSSNDEGPTAIIGGQLADKRSAVKERKAQIRTYPILYSPFYYWFRFLVGVAFLIVNSVYTHRYIEHCSPYGNIPSAHYSPGNIWYISMDVFWSLEVAVHGLLIVRRFLTKRQVTDTLYDGPFERALKWPMVLLLVVVIGMSIWGLVLANEDPICGGEANKWIKVKAAIYLPVSVLLVANVMQFRRA